MTAPVLALLSAACFGAALIVTHMGLRGTTTYAGARISLTTTLVLWCVLAPFMLNGNHWQLAAGIIFAIVGLFYPAAVTVLTYESNRLLGPTITGTVSSSAPLFATALAVLVLGEHISAAVLTGSCIIVGALIVLSWTAREGAPIGWRLLLPLSGAALRGLAQALSKLGLTLWPDPFAAAFIGYAVSGGAIWSYTLVRRAAPSESRDPSAFIWFMAAGVLNGCALLLLYYALHIGRVSVVAPLVALYPVFTMLLSAVFIRSERLTVRTAIGVLVAVAGAIVLVSG